MYNMVAAKYQYKKKCGILVSRIVGKLSESRKVIPSVRKARSKIHEESRGKSAKSRKIGLKVGTLWKVGKGQGLGRVGED